jgi:hypothetical protein
MTTGDLARLKMSGISLDMQLTLLCSVQTTEAGDRFNCGTMRKTLEMERRIGRMGKCRRGRGVVRPFREPTWGSEHRVWESCFDRGGEVKERQ